MDLIVMLLILFLILFMILAIYDGLYLHLWKFELFNRKESEMEHKIHTVRALLFPVIVYFLLIDKTTIGVYIGIAFFLADLIVLFLDAYYEEDSREFMDGLPRWEYIIHIFANSFHFASIVLIIIIRNNDTIHNSLISHVEVSSLLYMVGKTVIPGAILMGAIHLLLTFNIGKTVWRSLRAKVRCC